MVLRSPSAGRPGRSIPGTSASAPRYARGELLSLVEPLLQVLERRERDGGVELRHPGVEADEPAVVVARVPVVAPDPAPLREQIVVRRDEPPFAGDDDLRRRQAEHLGVAEAADLCAAVPRAERVGGVEEQPQAVAPRRSSAAPRRRRACRRCGSPGSPRCCMPTARSHRVRRQRQGVGVDVGERPAADRSTATACAVAANVNDGTITSPVSSAARSTSISPAVHEDDGDAVTDPEVVARRAPRSVARTDRSSGPAREDLLDVLGTDPGSRTRGRAKGSPSGNSGGACECGQGVGSDMAFIDLLICRRIMLWSACRRRERGLSAEEEDAPGDPRSGRSRRRWRCPPRPAASRQRPPARRTPPPIASSARWSATGSPAEPPARRRNVHGHPSGPGSGIRIGGWS